MGLCRTRRILYDTSILLITARHIFAGLQPRAPSNREEVGILVREFEGIAFAFQGVVKQKQIRLFFHHSGPLA